MLKCKGQFSLFKGLKNAASQCQVGVAEALQHLASGGATRAVFRIEYGKQKKWSGLAQYHGFNPTGHYFLSFPHLFNEKQFQS